MRVVLLKIAIILMLFFGINSCDGKNHSTDPGRNTPVVNFEIDKQAVWHEGLNLIAYAHGCPGFTEPDSEGIYIIEPDGSNKRYFYHGRFISGLDWSDDGRWILVDTNKILV